MPSHSTSPPAALLMCFVGVLGGCGSSGETGTEGATSTPPALPALAEAFGTAPAKTRSPHFAPEVFGRLTALEPVPRYLSVTDLRFMSPTARQGVVDVEVDRWPLSIAVSLSLEEASNAWRITALDTDGAYQRRSALLVAGGLPRAGAARPWLGGLSGRDAAGRPSAAILVLSTPLGLEIDGGAPLPADAPSTIAALKKAAARRQHLAEQAHATARLQAAFALSQDTPASELMRLTGLAREAGIREHLLVVRGADDGPAVLSMATPEAQPIGSGDALAPYLIVRPTPAGYVLAAAGEVVSLGDLADAAVPEHLGAAVRKLRDAHEGLLGLRLRTGPSTRHGQVVALLDAARLAAPDLPALPEVEDAAP